MDAYGMERLGLALCNFGQAGKQCAFQIRVQTRPLYNSPVRYTGTVSFVTILGYQNEGV